MGRILQMSLIFTEPLGTCGRLCWFSMLIVQRMSNLTTGNFSEFVYYMKFHDQVLGGGDAAALHVQQIC